MPRADTSEKARRDAVRARMRAHGLGYDQIAADFRSRFGYRPRAAWRHAYGWTLPQAAARYNAHAARLGLDPDGKAAMTGPHLGDHERWPDGETTRKPTPTVLAVLAAMFNTTAHQLLDLTDHDHLDTADRLHLDKPVHASTTSTPPGAEDRTPAGRGTGMMPRQEEVGTVGSASPVNQAVALNGRQVGLPRPPRLPVGYRGDNGTEIVSADGGEEDDPTKRRDVLGLGLAAAVTSELLGDVLGDSAAEAMEFTRVVGASGVGKGTLDHLDAVMMDLQRAYEHAYAAEPPGQLFVAARVYRRRVHELLQGPATLTERRQLYVHAAWLDELLAWIAQRFGDSGAARAYAIDCFEHAEQAGHSELCAHAMATLVELAIYADRPRPDVALASARKGLAKVPAGHPLAVRLWAHAAKASARAGDRDGCREFLAEAQNVYERMPSAPVSFDLDPGTRWSDYATTAYPTTAYLWIGDFAEAKCWADQAASARDTAHAQASTPSTGASCRLDLAIALVGLGAPDEAIGEARRALTSLGSAAKGSDVNFLRSRTGELDATLRRRYPNLPEAREFHEQYFALTQELR